MKNLQESIVRAKELMNLSESTLLPPLDGELYVTSPYGAKRSYEIHPGVDLRARTPQDIKSPLDGKVTVADMNHNNMCGGTVDIEHTDGYKSRFCHCSQIFVKSGDIIRRGQVVAKTGGDKNDPGRGNSRARHLHWTLKKNGQKVDPMKHIGAPASSLVGIPDQPVTGLGQEITPTTTQTNITPTIASLSPELNNILNSNFKGQKVSDILSKINVDISGDLFRKFLSMITRS